MLLSILCAAGLASVSATNAPGLPAHAGPRVVQDDEKAAVEAMAQAESTYRRRLARLDRIEEIAKGQGNQEMLAEVSELRAQSEEVYGRRMAKIREQAGRVTFQLARKRLTDRLERSGKQSAATAGDLVAVCHGPAGQAGTRKTLYLPKSAADAHVAHGDALGPCGQPAQAGSGRATPQRAAPVEPDGLKLQKQRAGTPGALRRPGGLEDAGAEPPDAETKKERDPRVIIVPPKEVGEGPRGDKRRPLRKMGKKKKSDPKPPQR